MFWCYGYINVSFRVLLGAGLGLCAATVCTVFFDHSENVVFERLNAKNTDEVKYFVR